MKHKKSKLLRKLQREAGVILNDSDDKKEFLKMAKVMADHQYNNSLEITEELINALKDTMPEADLRHFKELNWRFNKERQSFFSPPGGFWVNEDGTVDEFGEKF